jgi:hypothetical protein
MKPIQIIVTSLKNVGIYHLIGNRALTHKSISVYPDNSLIRAAIAGLSKVPWLSMVKRIHDGKSKGKRLSLRFSTDSAELIESCSYLSSLTDATDLPSEAQELWKLLQRFAVLRWTRLDEGATTELKQWAQTAATGGAE